MTKDSSLFAVISDIHGNLDALEAVLADIRQFPVSQIFCLGDIVGYGPEPAKCVQIVMDKCSACVSGNHESLLFVGLKMLEEDWQDCISHPIQLACEQLSKPQIEWLRSLPLTIRIGTSTLCHASLHEPNEYHYIDEIAAADLHFAAQKSPISFHGHTHMPVLWEKQRKLHKCYMLSEKSIKLQSRKRYAINCGSVGQPRDRNPHASYVLYAPEDRVLIHRRVNYDIETAIKRFKKANLPVENATRLITGE